MSILARTIVQLCRQGTFRAPGLLRFLAASSCHIGAPQLVPRTSPPESVMSVCHCAKSALPGAEITTALKTDSFNHFHVTPLSLASALSSTPARAQRPGQAHRATSLVDHGVLALPHMCGLCPVQQPVPWLADLSHYHRCARFWRAALARHHSCYRAWSSWCKFAPTGAFY